MRLRSWRGSTPLSPTPRRPFPWARVLLVLAIVAVAAYIFVPGYLYIRADGLVQGDLVPVAPLYRVRVDKLLVHCQDHVTAGEKVAMVSNFLVQADYQRQYLQSVEQVQLSRVALNERVATAQTDAASLREKYEAARLDEQRTHQAFLSYDRAYKQGAIPAVDWQGKRTEWQTAQANAQSAYSDWQRSLQEIGRINASENAKIASNEELSSGAQALAQRVGGEPLVAPVSGYVVDCIERPQNVLEPSTPLFSIFEPNRAYVVAYFDPATVSKLHLNQNVDVNIAGLSSPVAGRIGVIYPSLSKLPPQLTRFFWQHVQWTEYRPVRIMLDRLTADQRQQLYYDAQARISIRVRDSVLALGPKN